MASFVDEPDADKRFSLMKLPFEIRRRVFQQYFQGLLFFRTNIIIPRKKKVLCNCLPLDRTICRPFDMKLAFTSKAVNHEVLSAFVETYTFHFGCGCELSEWFVAAQKDDPD